MKTVAKVAFVSIFIATTGSAVLSHEPQSSGEALIDGIITGMGGDPGGYDRGYQAGSQGIRDAWRDGYEAGAGMTPGPYEVPPGGSYDAGLSGAIDGGWGFGGSAELPMAPKNLQRQ